MTQQEETTEIQDDLKTISISEATLAYLSPIENMLSVLAPRIKNKELPEAEETIDLITTELTETPEPTETSTLLTQTDEEEA